MFSIVVRENTNKCYIIIVGMVIKKSSWCWEEITGRDLPREDGQGFLEEELLCKHGLGNRRGLNAKLHIIDANKDMHSHQLKAEFLSLKAHG